MFFQEFSEDLALNVTREKQKHTRTRHAFPRALLQLFQSGKKKGEIWRRRTLQFLLGVLDDGNVWHFVAKRNNLDTQNPIKTSGSKSGYQDRFPDI